MAVPVYVNAGAFTEQASASSITLALPASVVAGNFLIYIVLSKNAASHTPPAGWTSYSNSTHPSATFHLGVAWKIATASETAPVVAVGATTTCSGQVFQFSGTNNFPWGNAATAAPAASTTHGSNAITSRAADSLALYFDLSNAAGSVAEPSGWTELSDANGATSATTIAVSSKVLGVAGSSTGAPSTTGPNAAYYGITAELSNSSYISVPITGISTTTANCVGPFQGTSEAAHITQDSTTGSANFGGNGYHTMGQSFAPTSTIICSSISLYLLKNGTPTDNLTIEIRVTTPTGALVATSNVVAGSSLSTSFGKITFPFSSLPTLANGTTYYFVIKRSGAQSGTNNYTTHIAGDLYAGGSLQFTFNGTSWSPQSDQDVRFSVNTSVAAYYFIGRDSGAADQLQCQKATDPTSSFAAVGTDPTVSSSKDILTISADRVGNIIHVVTVSADDYALVDFRYHTFNMATDAWVISNETIQSAIDVRDSGLGPAIGAGIAVRSDGTVVVLYNGARGSSMGTSYARQVYALRATNGTWTTNVAVDPGGQVNYTGSEAVLGLADRVHFFYVGAGSSNYTRTLNGTTLQTAVNPSGSTNLFSGVSYDDAGTLRVAGASGSVPSRFLYFISADVPTPVNEQTGVTSGADLVAVFVDGTELWYVYRKTADADLYAKKSITDGSTWGSELSVFVGNVSTLSKDGEIYQRGSNVVIPYIIDDSGTLKYNEYVIRVVTDDAWNSGDKDSAITLSNNDKTATTTALSNSGVRSTTLNSTSVAGKYYAEFKIDNVISAWPYVGLANRASSLVQASYTDTIDIRVDGLIYKEGVSTGVDLGTVVDNDVISIAWDTAAQKVWFRLNAGNWNNSGSDNPATNTGGTSISDFAVGSYGLCTFLRNADEAVTLRTETAELTVGTYPSGFTSWMGEALPSSGPVANNLTVGSPVLGTPSLLSPKANNLTTSSPVLGTPAFSATVILSANSLTVVSPVLGNPAFQPTVSMTANAITVVSPALGNPAITQRHALGASVFATGPPALGNPSLLNPKANALTVSSPVLGTPSLLSPKANALTVSSPVLGTPALVAISGYDLTANALTVTSPALGTPAFAGIGWTPEQIITGMVGWFDAADPGSLTFSGANLTVWGDGSSAASNATPYSSGPTLTSINNLGALNFNGAQGLHRAATTFGDFSIFVLFKPSTGGTAERLIDHSYQNGFWIGRSVAGTAEWGGGIQHIVDPYGRYVAFSENVTHQIFYQRTGTTQNVVGNGGTVSTSGSCPSTTTTSNLVAIGTGYDDTAPSDRLNNDVIGEIIIWSRAISASEQAKTEGYLAWKWGIVASLPGGHPYKTSPPSLVDTEDNLTANSLTVTSPSLGTPSLLSPKANALTVSSPVIGTPSLLSPKANALTVSSPVLGTPSLLSPKANALTVSSPVLGTPAFTQKQAFTANAITVVSPALGNPSLLSPKANALTVSSPVLGSPAITQTHIRTANNLTVGLPAIGTPSLLSPKANNLTVSSPVIGTPSLLNPKANALTVSSPVLGTPSLLSPKANNLTVGSPIVIPPSFTQNGTTTASPIVVESPDIGTPAFTQKHIFTANAITVASPVIGTPAFTGIVTFTANAITTVSPALGSPAITQKHAFTANALTVVSPAIGNPAITQKHIRTANNLTVTSPAIGTPAFVQKHAFTANALTVVSPAIGTPAITQKHVFTTSLTVGSPVFGNAVLSINGQTTANPIIVASPVIGSPAITQKHVLAANALPVVSPAIGTPAFTARVSLSANSLTVSSPAIGVPAFKQRHTFVANAITTNAPVIGTPIFFVPSEGDAIGIEVGSPEIGSPVLFAFFPLIATKLTVGRPVIGRPMLSKIDDYARKIYPRRGSGIIGTDTSSAIWHSTRSQNGIRGST